MRKIAPPYTDPAPLFRHGGARRPAQRDVLDFSASVNPLGPPASVLRALRDGLPEIAHYPDPECRELTERIAAHHGVDPAMVVVGNGSNELIYAIARAFRPKRVAIAEPTYTEYLRASLLVGAEVDHWLAEGEEFKPEPFDPGGADLAWLCQPNNPTGALWPAARELACWIGSHRQTLFVVDEAFEPLCWWSGRGSDRFNPSLVGAAGRCSNLIVLRSLTKVFALPGIRIGYSVSSAELATRIRGQLPTWSVNGLAQIAGVAALDDEDYQSETRRWLTERLTPAPCGGPVPPSFVDLLGEVSRSLEAHRTATTFVLARLRHETSGNLCARMSERGILIRDASNYVGLDERYVRIAIRTPAENERLFAALADVLRG